MISVTTILTILKTHSSFAVLAAAILNYVAAERAKQFEIVREMGTLACEIENRKLLGQESEMLMQQYSKLAVLRKA